MRIVKFGMHIEFKSDSKAGEVLNDKNARMKIVRIKLKRILEEEGLRSSVNLYERYFNFFLLIILTLIVLNCICKSRVFN